MSSSYSPVAIHLSPAMVHTIDAAGISVVAGALFGHFPPIMAGVAGLLGAIWYGLQIWESPLVQKHLRKGQPSAAQERDDQTQEAIRVLLEERHDAHQDSSPASD